MLTQFLEDVVNHFTRSGTADNVTDQLKGLLLHDDTVLSRLLALIQVADETLPLLSRPAGLLRAYRVFHGRILGGVKEVDLLAGRVGCPHSQRRVRLHGHRGILLACRCAQILRHELRQPLRTERFDNLYFNVIGRVVCNIFESPE